MALALGLGVWPSLRSAGPALAADSANPCKGGRVLYQGKCVAPESVPAAAIQPEPLQPPPLPAKAAAPAPLQSTGEARVRSMSHAAAAIPLPIDGPTGSELPVRMVEPAPPVAPRTPVVRTVAPGVADAPEEPKTQVAVDSTGVALTYEKKLESERVRQAWMERGGSITSYEMTANGTFLMMYDQNMLGGGLGAGLKVAVLSFKAPSYEKRDTSWSAFKVGVGCDLSVFGTSIKTKGLPPPFGSGGVTTMTSSMKQASVPFSLGVVGAWGSFDSPTEWSGFSAGIDWAPSFTASVSGSGSDTSTTTNFNYAGLAINFQSGNLKAHLQDISKDAHFKLSIFVLPPINSKFPLLITTNIGAVWY